MPWRFFGKTGYLKPPIAVTGVTVGEIIPFAGAIAPTGYLLCNGAVIDAIANPDYLPLFNALTQNGTVGLFGAFSFAAKTATLPNTGNRLVQGVASSVNPGGVGGYTLNPPTSGHFHTQAHQHAENGHSHDPPGGTGHNHRHYHYHGVPNHQHNAGDLIAAAGPPTSASVTSNAAVGTDNVGTARHGHDVDGTVGVQDALTTNNDLYVNSTSIGSTTGTTAGLFGLSAISTLSETTAQQPPHVALNFIIKW